MNQIDNYPWEQYKDLKAEAAAVRKTVQEATKLILDASLRYKQKKLKARSKKQAADLAGLFKDLELYRNQEEIRDAYGWDIITEAEADRLYALWDAREKYVKENGKFSDPVTELLEHATRYINDEGRDLIELVSEMEQILAEQEKERHRADVEWERKKILKKSERLKRRKLWREQKRTLGARYRRSVKRSALSKGTS